MKAPQKSLVILAVMIPMTAIFFQNCGQFSGSHSGSSSQNASSVDPGPSPVADPSPTPTPGPAPAPSPAPAPGPAPTPVVLQNVFQTMPQTGDVPTARFWGASAFLTGKNKFFIWGGLRRNGNQTVGINDGAVYDLATGNWKKTSMVGAPQALYGSAAIWTGTKVIVWGGGVLGGQDSNQGWTYDPDADTWAALPQMNTPSARKNHFMAWLDSKMVIWSGYTSVALTDGAAYDPTNGVWTPIATAPISGRSNPYGAAMGNRMIVWGGGGNTDLVGGAIYDLATNTWKLINNVGAPTPTRFQGAAAWTGSQFVVYGGQFTNGGGFTNTGGIYTPATDSWAALPANNGPIGGLFYFGWTGTDLILWGGNLQSGASNSGVLFH